MPILKTRTTTNKAIKNELDAGRMSGSFDKSPFEMVQISNGQEKAQSERDSHSKTEVGKK